MENGWSDKKLGEVAEVIMGQSPPGDTYNEIGEGLPFYQGVADFGERHPTRRVYCSAPTRISECGDILFSVRAPIGRVNIATEKCSIGRGLAIIRTHNLGDRTFVEFLLRAKSAEWEALEGAGSVFGNAKKEDLLRLEIVWPETPERNAISHILGTLDDKIELNRRMNETLEQMDWVEEPPVIDKKVLFFSDLVPDGEMEESKKFARCLPVLSLEVAATSFREQRTPEIIGWKPVNNRKIHNDMFIAQVVGKSMEPTIPDGSFCLFRFERGGSRNGLVVLVESRLVSDPETSQSFTVKRYRSEKKNLGGGQWMHKKITLSPENKSFKKIVLNNVSGEDFRVVAEFLGVME